MLKIYIQLFAEGGGEATGASVPAAGEQAEGTATTTETQNSSEDRAAKYKQFKTDYKDEFNTEVQGIVKERLKKANAEAKEHANFKGKADRITEALAVKYGIDATDLDGLVEAVENDNSYYEDAAYKEGMGVEEFKHLKTIENENRRLKDASAQAQQEERQRQFIDRVTREGQIAKASYPDFDLQTESQNPQFRKLVEANVDVRTAYEIIHKDEFMRAAQYQAANAVSSKMQADAVANSRRPAEGAVSSPNAVSTSTDISKLTPKQMQEMKDRARRGEKITFTK